MSPRAPAGEELDQIRQGRGAWGRDELGKDSGQGPMRGGWKLLEASAGGQGPSPQVSKYLFGHQNQLERCGLQAGCILSPPQSSSAPLWCLCLASAGCGAPSSFAFEEELAQEHTAGGWQEESETPDPDSQIRPSPKEEEAQCHLPAYLRPHWG